MAPAGVNPNPAPAITQVVQGAIEKSNVNARRRDGAHDRDHAQLHRYRRILQQQGDQRRNALQQLSQTPSSSS